MDKEQKDVIKNSIKQKNANQGFKIVKKMEF